MSDAAAEGMNDEWHSLAWLAVALVLATVGCGSEDDPSTDGGVMDAGPKAMNDGGEDADAGTDPCIGCVQALGGCTADGGRNTPNVTEALAQVTAFCNPDAGAGRIRSAAEARCADGKTVLLRSFGLSVDHSYFNDAGAFVGVTYESDAIDAVCLGKRYWPTRMSCTQAEITRVLCGSGFTLGQALSNL